MFEVIDLSLLVNPSTEVEREKLGPYADPPTTFDRYISDYQYLGYIITRLDIGAHIGTHCDVPIHYRKGGASVSDLPISSFLGWAIVMNFYGHRGEIDALSLRPFKKKIAGQNDVIPVLLHGHDNPLTNEARHEIISWKPKIIMMGEGGNPDDRYLDSKGFLEADIAMIMNPDPVQTRKLRDGDLIVAAPLKLEGLEASPIRLLAIRGLNPHKTEQKAPRLFGRW